MIFEQWFRGYSKRQGLSVEQAQAAQPHARAAWDALARDVARFMDRQEAESGRARAFTEARSYLAP